MKHLVWMLPLLGLVAACDTAQGNQMLGTATGAALGAAVAPDGKKTEGALIGATAGLIAGSMIAPATPTSSGQCLWERPDGTRYSAPCPA
jgi:CDP-diglyceride synthetase